MTKIIVRRLKEKYGGNIIIFFPEDSATKGKLLSWMLIGQHGELSLAAYYDCTLPVSDEEAKQAFADYCKEYYIRDKEKKFYKIRKRISYAMLKKAWNY